jgi:hypothetical protein
LCWYLESRPTSAHDAQLLLEVAGTADKFFRRGLSDRKVEKVASFKGILRDRELPWFGLAPDGSVLAFQDNGNMQIHALDWEE